jgi:YesN/AraC family two-component response regulator
MLGNRLPDLIITDVMMPVKDGISLLKEIKANVLTSHIPVVLLSAKASAEAKMEAMAAGAQAYLAKPFLPDELVAVVANMLDVLQKANRNFLAPTADAEGSNTEQLQNVDPFARRCYELINEHMDDAQLSVERLADLLNVNRSHFQRKIKSITGYSPSELIRTMRLEKAQQLLRQGEKNITETAYATGFTSQSYFTKCFTDHFGYPPSLEGNSGNS